LLRFPSLQLSPHSFLVGREGTCVDTNGLRWGDAGAEGLRMVLPAVDLMDGPDKDPFPDSRHAKPGGVEIFIFLASHHTSSQAAWQAINAVVRHIPLLYPS
jgi:hypothetical protein